MPTQSIPLRCPFCDGGTIEFRRGRPPRCMNPRCARDLPVGPPAPTEADRLRALLARFVALVEFDKPAFRSDCRWGPLYRDAKAAVDCSPLPQEAPADAPPSR